MYINFWYAAERSEKLTADKPLRVRMLSHEFVLFRDSKGKAHCLSDTCIHRGAALSGGKVMGDCVQCPYHGWQYNGSGRCVSIPSLGPEGRKKVPPRGQVDGYPTEERYGLIFVFLGDLSEEERPPIMPIPEWGKDGWRANTMDYHWNANYERAVENGLDPAHNEFVHPTHGYSGERAEYKVHELRIDHHDYGFEFMHTFQSPPLKNWLMKRIRNYDGPLDAGSGHHGPNGLYTYIHLTPTKWFHQYVWETPVDEHHLHTFLVSMRNCMIPKNQYFLKVADRTMDKRNFAIAEQDRAVIEKLDPVCTPAERSTRELLMPADKVIWLYRERLEQWDDKGWRIDADELKRMRAKRNVVYAIPSPARRKSQAWVLDPVPLVEPKPTAQPLRAVGA